MNQFEKQQIVAAFKQCFGLQEAFSKGICSHNKNYKTEVINSLARQSGLRVSFIENNLEEILKLNE